MGYRRPYKENVRLQFITKFIVEMIIVSSAAYLLITYTCEQTVVVGSSMNEILEDGQTVLVNRLAYLFNGPQRYDIVYFRAQGIDSSRTYIKRIIGLPGETVQITDGVIYINGIPLQDDITDDIILSPGLAKEPIVLGEDEYFVLGDNRNNSEDSRFAAVGNVRKKNIIGKPWVIISPFSEFRLIQ